MPSHRAPKLSTRKTSAFAIAGIATGSVLLMQPGSAQAETLKQAQADYNQKMQQSEAATEAYNAANTQSAQLQQKVNTLQAQISTDTAQMSALQRAMGLQAAQQYENAGMSDTLKLALESSPETYLNDALANNEVATKEAQLLKTLEADKAQIAADQKLANSELAQQQAVAATARAKKQAAVNAASQAKAVYDSLSAAQQQVINQAQAGISPVNVGSVPAPNSRAASAVAFAEAQIGKPYVYAAAGPSAFDCSGLTMEAWAAAGVSLPHNAAAQYDMLTHISESQAQPGDLVFFDFGEGGITHVGIYVGNGVMVHAPHTGTDVQYGNVNNMGAIATYFARV